MDRISMLPDDVICHILSFLPTKHAVATSVLSSRWLDLWTFLTVIDLDDSLYLNPLRKSSNSELFIRFFDMVSCLNESETIVKFRLYMHYSHGQSLSDINGFIHNVFLRDVVESDIRLFFTFDDDDYDEFLEIPLSESLTVLKVRTPYCLKIPAFPGCFPSLRVFDAKFKLDQDDELMINLLPCLPSLEKLCLVADLSECSGEIYVNVGGDALKHLELELSDWEHDECDAMVVIDAPKLEYLRLQDDCLASYMVKHKPTISEVTLHVGEELDILDELGPTRLTRFDELLHGLVNTKFISVSAFILKVIFLQKWNLPMLPYVTKVELEVPASSWILLLHWLQSCPNLKVLSLIIKENGEDFEEVEWMVPDVVPSCLSSCVKEIEIKRRGKVDEEEMLKYLLYNATILDTLTVDSRVYIKEGILC